MPDIDPLIKLTDTISIKMKWPSYKSLFGDKDMSKLNESEQAFALINQCIDSVITEEESISVKDVSEKELNDFVESLNSNQFKMVENFFETMPKLSHTINVTNPNTKVDSEIKIEGLQSFFG